MSLFPLPNHIVQFACRFEPFKHRVPRALHRTRGRVRKRDRSNCYCRLRENKLVLAALPVRLYSIDWSIMGNRTDGCTLIGSYEFNLFQHPARDSNCMPAILSCEYFIEAFFLGRNDNCVRRIGNCCHFSVGGGSFWRCHRLRELERTQADYRKDLQYLSLRNPGCQLFQPRLVTPPEVRCRCQDSNA